MRWRITRPLYDTRVVRSDFLNLFRRWSRLDYNSVIKVCGRVIKTSTNLRCRAMHAQPSLLGRVPRFDRTGISVTLPEFPLEIFGSS
jgi:hypothetical protein